MPPSRAIPTATGTERELEICKSIIDNELGLALGTPNQVVAHLVEGIADHQGISVADTSQYAIGESALGNLVNHPSKSPRRESHAQSAN
jgi:hypothetical protein